MNLDSRILILGANGMVGKAVETNLRRKGYTTIMNPRSANLNLLDQLHVNDYMKCCKFDYVFFFAAKVGGIFANIKSPAQFGYENAMMECNVIHAAHESKVKKVLFMGSSCIYPRDCPQPMKEEYLLTGKLEPTNEMYALAKILGLKLCESYNKQYNSTQFISCMPCNIYGEHDNFGESSHVMAALIERFHDAKEDNLPSVTCMGTGSAKREFINAKDVADACLFLMDNYTENTHINLGVGEEISIYDLSHLIAKVVGYTGQILWDTSKPDGMPRKVLDVTKINQLGWKSKISLEDGIKDAHKWFVETYR
jgi:GDP-L-fucose synthase